MKLRTSVLVFAGGLQPIGATDALPAHPTAIVRQSSGAVPATTDTMKKSSERRRDMTVHDIVRTAHEDLDGQIRPDAMRNAPPPGAVPRTSDTRNRYLVVVNSTTAVAQSRFDFRVGEAPRTDVVEHRAGR